MTTLRKLDLNGFRGVRGNLSLDFTANTRSVAVYGGNGSGKSSISDAVEWFFRNKVEHLWREDCNAHALRNVNLKDGDTTSVSIEFQNGPPTGTRTLSSTLVSKLAPATSDPLKQYLAGAMSERLILRHQELTHFVTMSKGEKRKYVASIIGYDAVTSFRDVIQQTLNALKNTIEYTGAKGRIEGHRAGLLAVAGEILTTDKAYYARLDALLAELEIPLEEATPAAVVRAEAALNSRIKQGEKAKRKIQLQQLSEKLSLLKTELDVLTAHRAAFMPMYQTLMENLDQLKKVKLGDFLRRGKQILEEDGDLEACPFCLTEADVPILGEEVNDRIKQLEKTQAEHEAASAAMAQFVRTLQEVERLCGDCHGAVHGSMCSDDFVAELLKLSEAVRTHADGIAVSFGSHQTVVEATALTDAERKIRTLIDKEKKAVDDAEEKETLTHEEDAIVNLLKRIDAIRANYHGHQVDTAVIEAVERQILSLQTIFDEFKKVQTAAMQDALDVMSTDIGTFYNLMHPDENTDAVHLSIVGDEGVEFHYTFHGEKVRPPMKYLSESHLNSLGIALFLASVKLFNDTSKFFVLDDIVSSFDAGHRRRLLRLLQKEFADWQILLLTHENLWFEIIRREMRQYGWLFKEVAWDAANGSLLDETHATFRESIDRKKKRGEDIENDLRKLLEHILKEVCEDLEVKVAYRPNDENEKRTPGELISHLKGTLSKRKCNTLKSHDVFGKLEASAFLANIGSHANPEKLSSEDLEVTLEDIDELDGLFRCADCQSTISTQHYVPATKTIQCKCGRLSHPWQD